MAHRETIRIAFSITNSSDEFILEEELSKKSSRSARFYLLFLSLIISVIYYPQLNSPTVSITPSSKTQCTNIIQSLSATTTNTYSKVTESSGNIGQNIPDHSGTGTSNTQNISGVPSNASNIEIRVKFSVTHPINSQVEVNLEAPNGQILNLTANKGGSGSNYVNTEFYSTNTGADLPTSNTNDITGVYKANAATSGLIASSSIPNTSSWVSLLGEINGNWIIRVYDNTLTSPITSPQQLENWTIEVYYTLPPTWSPTTELYTDAAATIPYTGSNLTTVYAKPSITRTYTASATNTLIPETVTSDATITVTPDVGTPVFDLGVTSTKQQGVVWPDESEPEYLYTATASNSTGISYSLDATSLAAGCIINSSTGGVTYDPGYNGTAIITATASGTCGSPTNSTHTVTITPPQLYDYQCGTTLADINDYIYAYAVPGCTQYRFKIFDGTTTQTFDTPASVFYFTQFTSYEYGTTYSCQVAVLYDGVWTAFGPACSITTPTLTTTKIQSSQCGITLEAINTPIYANLIEGATQYRFRVNDGNSTQIFDNSSRMFLLTQFSGYAYGTAYTIDVNYYYGGVWQTYGASCIVSSPALNTSQIIASQCGITVTNLDMDLYANEITGATQYRFRISNGTSTTIDKLSRTFKLSQVNGISYGTTYTVDVAVYINGSWQEYGSSCNISTPIVTQTQLISTQCGITLGSIFTDLYANNVSGATSYRFRVTNGSNVQTVIKSSRTFKLSQLPNVYYGSVNIIEVDALVEGTWIGYGLSCNVTTPTIPNTNIISSQCGITLSTTSTYLFANEIPGASQYRFRLTKDGGATYLYVDRPSRLFSFSQLPNSDYTVSTVYTIDVAVLYNAVWQAYGSACTATTPGTYGMSKNDGQVNEIVIKQKELIEDFKDEENSSLSVGEIKTLPLEIVAFPNPFFSDFEIKINSTSNDPVEVLVYEASGKQIEYYTIQPEVLNKLQIGQTYQSGIYFIKVIQNKTINHLRVVKN